MANQMSYRGNKIQVKRSGNRNQLYINNQKIPTDNAEDMPGCFRSAYSYLPSPSLLDLGRVIIDQQLSMGQATKFLEVQDKIIFAAASILKRIPLAEGRRYGLIDASVDPESEVSDFACERNPGFLQAGSTAAPHRRVRPAPAASAARLTADIFAAAVDGCSRSTGR